jgi:long-chain acyl-CoA synthetase
VPDPDEGQVPIAYVVLRPGSAVSEQEMKEFLGGQIAAFKIPARILPIDRLPLTHSGKIDHAALAERFARDVGRAS